MILTFGILFVSIFKLAVIKKKYYDGLARENKITENLISAPRGKILDRKGRIIAQNISVFDELKREYPYGESLGLVSGYVGKVSEDEIKNNRCDKKLNKNELIGRGGIEDYFDCLLRGIDGKKLIEVDARGKYVRELGRLEPENGKDLSLSIDAFWQDKIYKLLDKKKATVVMSEPKTGKIIALVSSPSFDPNFFSNQKDDQIIGDYLNDRENLPLLNRTIAARYHPGSVFKIVVSTAGLEENVINKNTLYEDTGILKVGDYSFSNWLWTKNGTTDGMVDIVKAIRRSNDIYFYS